MGAMKIKISIYDMDILLILYYRVLQDGLTGIRVLPVSLGCYPVCSLNISKAYWYTGISYAHLSFFSISDPFFSISFSVTMMGEMRESSSV
jgi:hypothetical protein